MKKRIKKIACTVISAVTLSACTIFPASINQSADNSFLVNPIVAEAAYASYPREGIVIVGIAKMYDSNFKPFPLANVVMGTRVAILG